MSCCLEQILKLKRLHHIVIGSQLSGLVHVRLVRFRRHDDNGSVIKALVLTKRLTDFKPEESCHHQIEEDQIWHLLAGDLKPVFTIIGLNDVKSFTLKTHRHNPAKEILVVNNEYFGSQFSSCSKNVGFGGE